MRLEAQAGLRMNAVAQLLHEVTQALAVERQQHAEMKAPGPLAQGSTELPLRVTRAG